MMMKSILTACFALFCGVALFAQKPLNIAVWDDLSAPAPADGDSRTNYMVWEYFKSELATHAGFKIVQFTELNKAIEDGAFKRGKAVTAAQIAKLCADTKADYFCAVRIGRLESGKLISFVTIYNADGTVKGNVKREFESCKQSDMVSIYLARDAAVAIRGKNALDDVNLQRSVRTIQNVTSDSEKAEIRKNRDAIR